MENRGRYSGGQLLLAVLGGGVAGALAAILLAPRSGRETRERLSGYLHDAKLAAGRVPDALRTGSQAVGEALREVIATRPAS